MCVKAKHEALKEEYATYSRVLQETEDSLLRVNVERTQCTNELNEVRREIEMQYREKMRLEDEVMEKIRAQLSADKAAEYSAKIVRRLRERTKDLETQVQYDFLRQYSFVIRKRMSTESKNKKLGGGGPGDSYLRDTALPGGALQATHAVHLRLIGKPVVDFLLVIIELFCWV